MGLVQAPASTVLSINLEDLVPKAQAGQGSRGVCLDQLDEDTLEGHKYTQPIKGVFAIDGLYNTSKVMGDLKLCKHTVSQEQGARVQVELGSPL